MRRSWRTKVGVSLVLGACLFTSSGCFGGFNLVRKVYNFNKTVSRGKWVRELVFLVMVIVPVYQFASLIDAVIINSIEFWTGRNPVRVDAGPTTRVVERGDTRVVQTLTATPAARTMLLEEYHRGQLARTVVVTREEGQPSVTTRVRYPDGRAETHVATLEGDGGATIGSVDDEGRLTTRVVSAPDLGRVSDRIDVALATRSW